MANEKKEPEDSLVQELAAQVKALQAALESQKKETDKMSKRLDGDPWAEYPVTDDGYVILPGATQHPNDHPEYKHDPRYKWCGLHWVKSKSGAELRYKQEA